MPNQTRNTLLVESWELDEMFVFALRRKFPEAEIETTEWGIQYLNVTLETLNVHTYREFRKALSEMGLRAKVLNVSSLYKGVGGRLEEIPHDEVHWNVDGETTRYGWSYNGLGSEEPMLMLLDPAGYEQAQDRSGRRVEGYWK